MEKAKRILSITGKVFNILYQIVLTCIAITMIYFGISMSIEILNYSTNGIFQEICQCLSLIGFGGIACFGFVSLCILSKK